MEALKSNIEIAAEAFRADFISNIGSDCGSEAIMQCVECRQFFKRGDELCNCESMKDIKEAING